MYINISKVDFGKYYQGGSGGGGVTPEPDYLCFTSTGDSTVAMTQNGTPSTSANKVIQYKLNDGQWKNWDLSAVTLHDGDKMYLKSVNEIPMSEADSICKQFVMTGSIAASGNIMSLLNFSDTLTDYAFYRLFQDCSSLTQAPKLPATTLSVYCYSNMFYECTSLIAAPDLPATTLAQYCYSQMFNGCTALTTAPELPATTLVWYCYFNMFNGCSSLTTAPELHATSLGISCYKSMFSGCSSLTQAPALPATELVEECYYSMFANCTSLTTAPELPATTLVEGCYSFMFLWCPNLNYVKALFTTDPTTGTYLTDWLNGVSETGTFDKSKDATWSNTDAGIPTGWTILVEGVVPPEPEPEKDYLCFTSTGDSTVSMSQKGTPETSANKVIQYKINNGQWQNWDLSAVTLADGDKMYLKSDDEIPIGENIFNIYKYFVMTGNIAASGNTMSLLNFNNTCTDCCFSNLFIDCTSLTDAPELPATTLAPWCYYKMFQGCTSLTQAPALPATTLKSACYEYMFSDCTSLTTAPELPALNLAQSCYDDMFQGCTSLTQAPALPATTLINNCYGYMFKGCTSLTQAPALPATTLADSCYAFMFGYCTSLTQAPELPATQLVQGCYRYMLSGCKKLNYVKAMFTDVPSEGNPVGSWLNNVSPTGTFVKNSAATWTNEQAGIPTGWTVQTASPDK